MTVVHRNATDPLWRVGLLDPNGTIYAWPDHPYGRLSTDVLAEAEEDYNKPRAPNFPRGWGWRDAVGAIVLFKWNPLESQWDQVKRRKPKKGECGQ